MCGIAGIFDPTNQLPAGQLRGALQAMQAALRHRGPDSDGVWVDAGESCGFAHCRLAIVDLSVSGSQPFHSADGEVILSYNGEIYNHQRLRESVARQREFTWRGHSDTETLAESLAKLGVPGTLSALSGMYAFGAYMRRDRTLLLARDRFGQKPLHYWSNGRIVVFASDVRALIASRLVPLRLDPEALECYAAWNFIPAPLAILQGVLKVEPGSFVVIRQAPDRPELTLTSQSYHRTRELFQQYEPSRVQPRSELHAVDEALRGAVETELLGDVPFGCFLSGGVDSALVSAITQRVWGGKIDLFTIGFEDPRLDEAPRAREIARQLNANHHVAYIGERELGEHFDEILNGLDEPHGDASFAPTWFVSRLARERVKYALSGDGGDEVFLGYNRHKLARFSDWFLEHFNSSHWMTRLLLAARDRVRGRQDLIAEVVRKVGLAVNFKGDELYRRLTTFNENSTSSSRALFWTRELGMTDSDSRLLAVTLGDLTCYLPDNGLRKVDMASMANSLEVRVPFLDDGVVGTALRAPLESRVNAASNKLLLRQLLPKYFDNLAPFSGKRGFSPPAGRWLRGPLAAWLETCRAEREKMSPLIQSATNSLAGDLAWKSPRGTEHIWGACILIDWCSRRGIYE